MTKQISAADWVYVAVQNPGQTETIVGQHDADHDITFIPVFMDRDSAIQGAVHLAQQPGEKFEIQAIIYEDLLRYAHAGGFLIFLLDARGQIQGKMGPDGQPF